MRRFVTLAVLLLFTVPFGVSISGCSKGTPTVYCNGQDSGVKVGQTVSLDLEPRLTGISINQGAIGSIGAPSGKDCQGNTASTSGIVYGSSNLNLVDVNPTQGSGGLCAGTWNRNSGGGIANYTVCTPNGGEGVAYITASAQGVSSNAVAVYVHPIITSIVLGPASTNCTTDPASNCFDTTIQSTCLSTPSVVAPSYTGNSCISQGSAVQLAARAYAGTGSAQSNISCLVGPLQFTSSTASIVNITTDGLATAAQPGATIISASNSLASSTAGFFSTCPPTSISLALEGASGPPTGPVTLSQNIPQPFVSTVLDTHGIPLTNIALEYESTTPATIPATTGSVTPTFPGSAAITALCAPPTCNNAPFDLIGLFGNGTTVSSQPVDVVANGTGNSTVVYIASTQSQYIIPYDFNVATQTTPTRMPYAPNSLVLSEDGNTIYMGTSVELMTYSTITNSISKQDTTVSGTVLAVAPNNGEIIITDPIRKLTYLYSTSGSVITQYGGVAISAQFSPDSSTVYIVTDDQRLLAYSSYTGWDAVTLPVQPYGVAITVPNAGIYLSGNPIDARTNCPVTSVSGSGVSTTTTNVFYPEAPNSPIAGTSATNPVVPGTTANFNFPTNNIASTNDGKHEIAASPTTLTDIATNQKSGACPVNFTNTVKATLPFTVAAPTAITGVLPTSDSAFTFVTYTGAGGVVPQYIPATGVLTNIPLQTTSAGAPIAPVAGVVSSDNQTFYVGTSGDNLVHVLTRGTNGFTDTTPPLTPNLPLYSPTGAPTTGTAVPNFIVQKPIKATN
jgi:hypothetical protein